MKSVVSTQNNRSLFSSARTIASSRPSDNGRGILPILRHEPPRTSRRDVNEHRHSRRVREPCATVDGPPVRCRAQALSSSTEPPSAGSAMPAAAAAAVIRHHPDNRRPARIMDPSVVQPAKRIAPQSPAREERAPAPVRGVAARADARGTGALQSRRGRRWRDNADGIPHG